MISIDEIDVRVARRPKQNSIAGRLSNGCMRGWIFSTEVSFDLNDTGCEFFPALAPDENFPQQLWAHDSGIAVIKSTPKNAERSHRKIIA